MKALKWLVVLCMSQALADTGYEGAPECVDAIDTGEIEHRLQLADDDLIRETFGLYATRCDGGLYLVDLQHYRKMWRVNESWWLEDIASIAWVDPGEADAIEVIASYITGIGPTGVQPFRARIVMHRGGGGPGGYSWTPAEPENIEDDAEDDYTVSYEIYSPRIGIADVQYSTVWALIPKDAVEVRIIENGRRPGRRRSDITSGHIFRGGLDPLRFASTFCRESGVAKIERRDHEDVTMVADRSPDRD